MIHEPIDEKEVFNSARRLAVLDERAAYLEQVCGHEPKALHRVMELLRVHDQESSFLESPAVAPGTTSDVPAVAEGPGTVIGPYKLLEQIGEGGMGLVFVAEQLRPVKRRVALKIIKPGMDSRQVLARFEAERQALALMDHANIAKVHDGGTTDGGRPYFVMELVKGKPITDYADMHRLTTRQRLELFLDVCHAVQHAHQKGVIHRDLKPSNVLVSLHDVRPVVKVIDFGIAKATGERLTDQSIYTGIAQMIGTPLYMSPEQAGLSDLDVDTRSDVYSLGVLLYELVTGTTPFASETLKNVGYDEMRRIIREDEPLRPSTRLSTMQQAALSTIEEKRGVEPRCLSQELRGELDWIVMKVLEKDRSRRYESASALAADVLRYLNDEPVEACPPSRWYRLRKFARRNRRALSTGGVIAVALVAATVVSAWQAVVAQDAQHQAEADRDRAKTAQHQAEAAKRQAATEAAIAQAVSDFLRSDLIGQAASAPPLDRESGVDPYLTVKEALDRAAARIGQRFQDQPLVEAAIRMAIGEAYRGLNDDGLAVPHLERALALRKALLGPDDLNTLHSMQALASAYLWEGRHSEAIALRQQLLVERKARLGPDHAEVLDCVSDLADAFRWASQLDTSRQLFEQVLEKRLVLFGPKHPATLGTMNLLAFNYHAAGRFEKAIDLNEKVLEILEATKGFERGWTYSVKSYLAQSCMRVGKFDQADRLLRDVRKYHQNREDYSHEQRISVGTLAGWQALSLLLQKQYAEAEPFAREAADIYAKYAPNTARRFYYESVLGAVLLGQQQYTEAEFFLLQGYKGMKRWERMSPRVISQLTEVAGWIDQFYEATDQPEKARAWRKKLAASKNPVE